MTIESLQGLSTLVLILSGANERLIEAIKNFGAKKLARVPSPNADEDDTTEDRKRQFWVQLLSVALATSIAAWVGDGRPWHWFFTYQVKTGTGNDTLSVTALMLGLLTSGGSAFWNSILDFTREAARLRERKVETLRLLNKSTSAGVALVSNQSVQLKV